jgi:hypothetical protein
VPEFTREKIQRLLEALNDELRRMKVRGELYLAGGAVMCLAFKARDSTRDVDAKFEPSVQVREAALRVSEREGVPDSWLNDAVRIYLSDRGSFNPYLDLSHLKVFTADARYMLAMKCLAMRIGEGYRDEEDIRYLLRNLDLDSYESAEKILAAYYEIDSYPERALLALRELLPKR